MKDSKDLKLTWGSVFSDVFSTTSVTVPDRPMTDPCDDLDSVTDVVEYDEIIRGLKQTHLDELVNLLQTLEHEEVV